MYLAVAWWEWQVHHRRFQISNQSREYRHSAEPINNHINPFIRMEVLVTNHQIRVNNLFNKLYNIVLSNRKNHQGLVLVIMRVDKVRN